MLSHRRLLRTSFLAIAGALAVPTLTLAGTLAGSAPPAKAGPKPDLGDYLCAVVASENDDFSLAAERMLRALAADPSNRALRQQAFLAVALAGRPEASRLASGLPEDPAAALLVANAQAAAGRWNEAARLYASVPHDQGLADVLRPVLIAWSQMGAGHADAALATLAPLLAGGRLTGFYALNAGLIADLAGRMEDAAADYHLAQTTSPGLNLLLVRVLASFASRHGHEADATGLVHALMGAAPSLAMAEKGIDAALARPPVANAREGLATAYRGVAAMLASQSQGSDAPDGPAASRGGTGTLLMLRYSLTLDPSSSETRLMMADVDQSLHVPAASLEALAPVPSSDPLFPLVELRRAELERAAGHDDAARAQLIALADNAPQQAEPWRELGEVLSDEHRYLEAVGAFDHAVAALGPPTGDDWSLFFDRAVALDRSHQWNRAEADLRRALALSPEEPYVLNYLGYSFAEQGRDLGQARSMLERALDQKPRDGAFLDSLGWILLKQGHVADAVDTLQKAAETTPEDPTVNFHLGVAYWQAGRKREAEDQWQRALILNPDPDDLPKIEARLHEAALDGRSPAVP